MICKRIAVALLVCHIGASATLGQVQKDLKATLWRDAPAKWIEYQKRARNLQGQYTITETDIQPKTRKTAQVDKFKQYAFGAVFERSQPRVLDGVPDQPNVQSSVVWGENDKYSFELRPQGTGGAWVAAALELGNEKPLRSLGKPVTEEVLKVVTQQFRGGMPKPLAEAINDRDFTVTVLKHIDEADSQHVQLDFKYRESAGPDARSYTASMTLDPARYWHIVRSVLQTVGKGYTSRYKVDYEFSVIGDGFPIIKRSTGRVETETERPGKAVFERVVAWDLRQDDAVAPREFKLSAFGLPEPLETASPPGPRYFVWFLGIGLGCFLTAGVIAYVRRRGRGANANHRI